MDCNHNNRFFDFPESVQKEQLERFKGICALYGYEGFFRLQNSHVVVIGNGGVGSWIAESLCRTGVGAITLLDFDQIELSNSNRQLHTLSSTIGAGKADALGARLKDINPYLKLKTMAVMLSRDNIATHLAEALAVDETRLSRFNRTTPDDLPTAAAIRKRQERLELEVSSLSDAALKPADTPVLAAGTYVAEAIDDLFAKAACVNLLHRAQIPFVTSGGAGGRIDPGKVHLGDITEARGDQLIKRLRTELRRNYGYPKGEGSDEAGSTAAAGSSVGAKNHSQQQKFNILCSYSTEKPVRSADRKELDVSPFELGLKDMPELPSFGAAVTVTATAGLLLASVIIRWIVGARIS